MFIKNERKKNKKIRLVFYILTAIFAGSYIYSWQQFVSSIYQTQQSETQTVLDSFDANTAILVKVAKKKAPVYVNLPGVDKVRAIVEDYTDATSLWAYVSKQNPILTNYTPPDLELLAVDTKSGKSESERSVRKIINTPLVNMFEAAKESGYLLIIGSGYRSASLQQLYLDSAAASIGIEAANQAIALPGQSEHQTGLAVDISSASLGCYLDECFSGTDDGKWLASNAHKFGFILRYPKGKELITGYQYEPWHFRYVGIDLATALYESNLTLDEAWPYILEAHNTLKNNGAI